MSPTHPVLVDLARRWAGRGTAERSGQVPMDVRWMSARLLTVVLVVLALPAGIGAVAQWGLVPWAWSLLASATPVTALLLAVSGHPRRAATALWVGLTTSMLLLPLVIDGPLTQQSWVLILFTVTAAGTALITRVSWISGALLVVLLVAAVVCRTKAQADADPGLIATDLVYGVAVWAVSWTVRGTLENAAEDVQHEREEAMRAFGHARAAEAEARAAQAWDSFLHDEVIAALAIISHGELGAAHRRAREIVAGAASVTADEVPSPPLAGGALETVLALLPSADTDISIVPEPLALPSQVRRAVIEALSEALRNIDRHARRPDGSLHATVRLRHDADAVEVRVTDDGVGFDLARVDPSRLGLVISVQGRMDAVGGVARIASRPGLGTSVVLRWPSL